MDRTLRLVFACAVMLGAQSATGQLGSSTEIELRVDRRAAGKPLIHFWSTCVGAGRANEGLRSSWQEHLAKVASAAGFRYVRFHGLWRQLTK